MPQYSDRCFALLFYQLLNEENGDVGGEGECFRNELR